MLGIENPNPQEQHLRLGSRQGEPLSRELAGPEPHPLQCSLQRGLLHEYDHSPPEPTKAQLGNARESQERLAER